jgi:Zn-dependent peptidase ImmA (M78 family)
MRGVEMSDYRAHVDIEADLFARCLLMPEDLVRKQLEKRAKAATLAAIDLCDDDCLVVNKLAKDFQVSYAMMIIRLQELGLIQ